MRGSKEMAARTSKNVFRSPRKFILGRKFIFWCLMECFCERLACLLIGEKIFRITFKIDNFCCGAADWMPKENTGTQ